MTDLDRPRVTFALFAYNQEQYIEEAVAAALAQTYSPLEIIISDDCSTDKTFGLIEKRVRDYHGPHCVVVNRNASNLGIGRHVNEVIQRSTGELILLAAGDDVSEIDRTREVVDYWLTKNRAIDAIWSDVRLIDEQGHPVGILRRPVSDDPIEAQLTQMIPALLGCSHATTKRLFLQYGPLREDITYEDRALAFRALCAGGVGRIEKLLVRYRVHASSVSDRLRVDRASRDIDKRLHDHRLHLQRKLAVYRGYQEDSKRIVPDVNGAVSVHRIAEIMRLLIKDNLIEQRIHSDSPKDRLSGFVQGFFRRSPSLSSRARHVLTLISPRLWFRVSAIWNRSKHRSQSPPRPQFL